MLNSENWLPAVPNCFNEICDKSELGVNGGEERSDERKVIVIVIVLDSSPPSPPPSLLSFAPRLISPLSARLGC